MSILSKLSENFSFSEYEKALRFLKEAADDYDYPEAMGKLAELAIFGKFSSKSDFLMAQHYCEMWIRHDKAPQGHFYLAWLEEEGFVTIKDSADPSISQVRILMHLLAAAEHDHPLAKMALGFKHLYGLNVDKDIAKSAMFYYSVADEVVKLPEYHIFPGRNYPAFNLNEDSDPSLITSGRPALLTPENLQYYELIGKSDSDNLVIVDFVPKFLFILSFCYLGNARSNVLFWL